MSLASNILSVTAAVTHAVHGDTLTLSPQGVTVTGYAQELDIKDTRGGKRLMTGATTLTHAVHISRSQLANVTMKDISHIEHGTRTYRVERFVNDPNLPDVTFYTALA